MHLSDQTAWMWMPTRSYIVRIFPNVPFCVTQTDIVMLHACLFWHAFIWVNIYSNCIAFKSDDKTNNDKTVRILIIINSTQTDQILDDNIMYRNVY